jgi:hypothetical protein
VGWATTFSQNHNIGSLYGPKCYRRYHYYFLKMSINGVWTIFVIAGLKIESVSLQPWLIIRLSPAFLGQTWLWHHRDYIPNMSVNGASTTFGLASWKMQGLHGNIKLSSNYHQPFYAKWLSLHCYIVLKMSVNGASTTSGHVSWKMQALCGDIDP